jgi:hypothetical protein
MSCSACLEIIIHCGRKFKAIYIVILKELLSQDNTNFALQLYVKTSQLFVSCPFLEEHLERELAK